MPIEAPYTGKNKGGRRSVIYRDAKGRTTAAKITGGTPGVNETQTVTVTADGGTFTLTYAGQTTAPIAWNATAAVVQAALEVLSNVGVGQVSVTGGPGGTSAFIVEFKGKLSRTNVAQMTSDVTLLELIGVAGDGTAAVATTQAGVRDVLNLRLPVRRVNVTGAVACTSLHGTSCFVRL